MSSEFKDAMDWLTSAPQPVMPNDPRWSAGMANVWWDEDTELDHKAPVLNYNEDGRMRFDPWEGRYVPVETKKCTCGAAATTNPNLHSTWCDLYKDPMGGKK